MEHISNLTKSNVLLISDTILLSQYDMQLIRGGSVPVKPTSRPRDRFDYEDEAQTAKSLQSEEESSLIDYIKFWFKNR